ncbi:FAD dependent oxidoreductase [Stagonosporopsis vannaccii]|nr:FAD dependent oxidoreductase [Stagonosporopsis vannaccii]
MAAEQPKRDIVIIGGGIIGCTTAYYLSQHPSFNKERDSITLVEATKIAGGASGKAGGLLGLWAYPSCIVPLSYRLHKELAEQHNGAERWGYRAVHCGQIDMYGVLKKEDDKARASNGHGDDHVSLQKRSNKAIGLLRAAGVPPDLDWIAPEAIQSYEAMGTPSTTAQVHPYQFTTSMATLAEESGAKIIYGSVTSINRASGAVTGVTYAPRDGGPAAVLAATTTIVTAGPWTRTVFPPAPISATRAHSVTIRPTRAVSAYALFTSIEQLPRGPAQRRAQPVTPEIYARPNQEVYACGDGDHLVPLPPSSDQVQVDDSRCQAVIDQVCSVSEELRGGEVTARQACYLPNVEGGAGPLIGETGTKGLLIGAGHTCWGVQNAPGTGKCLAELVWEGSVKSAELGGLDPRRVIRT